MIRRRVSFVLLTLLLFAAGGLGAEGTIRLEAVSIRADDGGISYGLYYTPEGKSPRTAVVILHPEGDSRMDWRCEPLARAGIGAYGMAGRYAKDDAHLIALISRTILDTGTRRILLPKLF